MITAHFASVLRVHAFSGLTAGEIVLSEPDAEVRLTLTTDVQRHVDAYARRTGLANMMLDMLGGPRFVDLPFEQRGDAYASEVKASIAGRAAGVLLVAEVSEATNLDFSNASGFRGLIG